MLALLFSVQKIKDLEISKIHKHGSRIRDGQELSSPTILGCEAGSQQMEENYEKNGIMLNLLGSIQRQQQ